MPPSFLTALPVFNEVKYVNEVLNLVKQYSENVLVIDDGSTDGTTEILAQRNDVIVIHHEQNSGYGAALNTAFQYAIDHGYDTGRGEEVAFGNGVVDFDEIFGLLEQQQYSGYFTVDREFSTNPKLEMAETVEHLKRI